MKTKIVYCLSSNNQDIYYEQLLISLYSLREHNPDAEVILVVDGMTSETLVDNRTKVFDYVSKVITVNTPKDYCQAMCSRYLKTSLRNIIDGDYLFIDTDTVICESLEEIDNCPYEIGAVYDNHHGEILDHQLYSLPEGHEWNSLRGTVHYNSGVFYVKDTLNTHFFYREWFRYWKEGAKMGFLFDQLPLRKVVKDNKVTKIGELNGIWNCQVIRKDSRPYWNMSKILHFQGSSSLCFFTLSDPVVYSEIKMKGDIPSRVKEIIHSNNRLYLLQRHIVIKGAEVEYFETPMREIYYDYPKLFDAFIKISKIYRTVITMLWNIKEKLLHKGRTK